MAVAGCAVVVVSYRLAEGEGRPSGAPGRAPWALPLVAANRLRELLDLIEALPRQVEVITAEVAISGGLSVDRSEQIQLAQDRRRTQVEDLGDAALDVLHRRLLGAD